MRPSLLQSTALVLLSSLWIDAAAFEPKAPAPSAVRPGRPAAAAPLRMASHASFGWTGRPDRFISNIFEANKRWKYGKLAEDPRFFDKLGSGHAPKYLWIGCADARVPANEIMGEDAGTVFVLRNVANMVVNTDFNLMSGLQYAVSVLKVPHIIVCGHYDCGGVRASMQRKDHGPPLENWLRNIRDVYRLHRKELDAIPDAEQRHRRLVELNVIEQCINLFKTGVVQRRRVETFRDRTKPENHMDPKTLDYTTPRIHACVFDPKTGDLNRLQVDFREYIDELHTIYDLYTLDEPEVLAEKPHAPMPVDEMEPHGPHLGQDPNDFFDRKNQEASGMNRPQYPQPSMYNSYTGPNGSGEPYGFYMGQGQLASQDWDPNDSYSSSNSFANANNRRDPHDVNHGYGALDGYRHGNRGELRPFSATEGDVRPGESYRSYGATDGAFDRHEGFKAYGATEGVRQHDENYATYGAEDHGGGLNGMHRSFETNNDDRDRYGPPDRRHQRFGSPSAGYLDGLHAAANGFPDGSNGSFSY